MTERKISPPPLLDLHDLHAGYGKHTILNGVSATLSPHAVTALVGPNGCGKSTLLKTIMGFVPLHRGHIRLAGQPAHTLGRRQRAQLLAYMPQDARCPDGLTVGELVELAGYARGSLFGGASASQRQRFHQTLEMVELLPYRGRPVNTLSGGQRQRAWIAMTLAQDTPLILMDEPVNHLDLKHQISTLKLVRTLAHHHDHTLLVVLHDLNLAAAFADLILMLKDGRVVAAGSPEETLTADNLRQVFGVQADIFKRHDRIVCLPFPEPA